MSQYDNPNQQVVRPDGSGPADEGTGGSGGNTADTQPPAAGSLDEMTKEQLLEHAQQLGVSPANAGMTKDELRAGIDAHQAAV
jgi:hypothetical protein